MSLLPYEGVTEDEALELLCPPRAPQMCVAAECMWWRWTGQTRVMLTHTGTATLRPDQVKLGCCGMVPK